MSKSWLSIWTFGSLGLSFGLTWEPGVGFPLLQEAPASPAQVPAEVPPEVAAEPTEAPPPEPWTGTFAAGIAEVLTRAQGDDLDGAVSVCDQLLTPGGYAKLRNSLSEKTTGLADRVLSPAESVLVNLGLERLSEPDRALVRYQRGLLNAYKGELPEAIEDLAAARAMGGSGSVRLDAVYALGTLNLMAGEVLRQRIPEISGAPPTPPPAPPSAPGAGPAEEEPDPIDLARAAYLKARDHLVERLRLDWQDANTRANVELVQRRLRELDEIERQREEQQSQDQEQEEDGEKQEGDPQDGEDSSDSDQQEGDEPPSGEEEPPDSPEDQTDPEDETSEEEADPEAEPELKELQLTEEELQRLMRILKEHEEKGELLREALLRQRRERVERDW